MSGDKPDSITLKGHDFSNILREVELEPHLWKKICKWHGSPGRAQDWVQQQIQLFSSRHADESELSQVIASIAFVEMTNPSCPRYPLSGRYEGNQQPEEPGSRQSISGFQAN